MLTRFTVWWERVVSTLPCSSEVSPFLGVDTPLLGGVCVCVCVFSLAESANQFISNKDHFLKVVLI